MYEAVQDSGILPAFINPMHATPNARGPQKRNWKKLVLWIGTRRSAIGIVSACADLLLLEGECVYAYTLSECHRLLSARIHFRNGIALRTGDSQRNN